VGQYSGQKKEIDCDLTVMNYQALSMAKKRGDIDRIDPALVIPDEAHHVIDGTWAEQVAEIAENRLLLGLTATPTYSSSKNVRRLFPTILGRKTLRQGIEQGILADMRGFVYQGSSQLKVTSKGLKDYTSEEIFNAVMNSRDNYLAAAICATEVSMGRKGIVSCAPGYDRAHAKVMAEILNHTPVKGKRRNIRAAFVDGETHPDVIREVIGKYRNGDIDVLTYVDLLLEGWDSPETEFGVNLRPTKSRVLAEQRVGRIVRPFPDKVATIHEILYQIEGDIKPQITYLDILDESKVVQGKSYGIPTPPTSTKKAPNYRGGRRDVRTFDVNEFILNSGLIREMTTINLDHFRQNSEVKAARGAIPFSWNSLNVLATKFHISREEAHEILDGSEVPHLTQKVNNIEHLLFSSCCTHHC
jgi:superfamily II DNA or RNA helicase